MFELNDFIYFLNSSKEWKKSVITRDKTEPGTTVFANSFRANNYEIVEETEYSNALIFRYISGKDLIAELILPLGTMEFVEKDDDTYIFYLSSLSVPLSSTDPHPFFIVEIVE